MNFLARSENFSPASTPSATPANNMDCNSVLLVADVDVWAGRVRRPCAKPSRSPGNRANSDTGQGGATVWPMAADASEGRAGEAPSPDVDGGSSQPTICKCESRIRFCRPV